MKVIEEVHGPAYHELQLDIPDDVTFDEWEDLLRGLGAMARSHQWWVGDAVVFGENRFGEEHAQALEALGLEPKTAQNYAYVAANVEVSRRREDLTWSHHAEVARLGKQAQRDALARAASEGWTVRQLRDYVAMTYPQSGGEPLFSEPGRDDDVETQRRLEEIEQRIEELDRTDRYGHRARITAEHLADVVWLLGLAKRLTRGGS